MESKIVMATVISFFPVLINTLVGLESVPEDSKMLMRSIRATRMQTFFRVSLPHALPIIFAGIRAAFVFAVIGAIVGGTVIIGRWPQSRRKWCGRSAGVADATL